ncbi:methionine/alanine import family NSS transporter small subunit [Nocardioides abyssi]|uniref:Methionine/alanine import family NSS transporter small subunit n=1 Tax=Nocardioides abyssi TaxID=3058370 RepID=A0ABT8EW07_9ACTN|nr:methionine/alanine import family NSS transporter small subunit [Nocardioides abyssi]MDN4162358.1 methionine/alanine import family NSS transporter small subunit [Nocardioides abyssi]
MSTEAIVMMVVAMVVLWGGLGAAVVNLLRQDTSGEPDHTHRDL